MSSQSAWLIGLTEQFANALEDRRHPSWTQHGFSEMVRSRVFGIIADYEDQNDHDVLRSDPVFKLIAGRSPAEDSLASQPTLSRFENAITIPMLRRLQDMFIDQFIASFDEPPGRLTFDIDVYDDPTHGHQQLTFFHGYYKQYQYQPRVITCANNDQVVMACLLFGMAHQALGAEDDLKYLLERLRRVWPDMDIELRADSGFAVPRMTQIMNLTHLAPDVQEALLFLRRTTSGRDPIHEKLLRPIAGEVDWAEQRRLWEELKCPWSIE